MREAFPDFQKNKYYQQRLDAEERRYIAIQQKSTIAFILYYRLVQGARRLKARIR